MTQLKNIDSNLKILLADDHPLMRQALKMWLKKQPGWEVIAEAADGEEAIRLTEQLNPDIVILDISMPKINGIQATEVISKKCPSTAVLILTVHSDQSTVLKIIQAGARGYLTKTVGGKQVVQAIRTIIGGETVWSLPMNMNNSLGEVPLTKNYSPDKRLRLSYRELEVLKMIAKGTSNKEIALRFGLQESSIKSCITSIFLKLNVGTRTEAVASALQQGTLSINDLRKDE